MKKCLVGLSIALVMLSIAVSVTVYGYNTVTVDVEVSDSYHPYYVTSYNSQLPDTLLVLQKNDMPFYVTSNYTLPIDEGDEIQLCIKVGKYPFIANRCYVLLDGKRYSCSLSFEEDMIPMMVFNEVLKAGELQ